jgi:phosphoribosylformimino-5-aminoimidazole carboxamide ribotide isomerase
MMIIFPAIDLKDGKCVRLVQGDYNKEQIFSDHPVEVALKWQSQGAKYLHLVDLDGALTGKPENKSSISKIVASLQIPVQLGGGIRSMDYAEELLAMGISRIILGTSALADPEFTRNIIKKYRNRVAVSLDAKNGLVAVKGWTELSVIKARDLANDLKQWGLQTIVYTDIAKDGMMSGPNFAELADIQMATGLHVIASGGVSTRQDIDRLEAMGLYGVIIGKALYTGDISLLDFKAKETL